MNIDVAVIGGGMSGLSAAQELRARGFSVVVLERQARPGGNAASERIGGFLMEHGPSTIPADSTIAAEYSQTLGLEPGRCDLGDDVRSRYLVKQGRLEGISTHALGFLTSNYLSLQGRLRMMAEFAVPRGGAALGQEESVEEFCTRRFGSEFSRAVMDPMVGGIYAGSAETLSVSAIFPKLVELEKKAGSIVRGAMLRRARGGRMPGSRLYSWRDGVGALPEALARRLASIVRTGVTVRRVTACAGGGFQVDLGADGKLKSRAVVVATQPHVSAQLLEHLDSETADAARAIPAPPLAVAFLGYRRDQIAHPLDGLGFLAPRNAGSLLNGAQFCSTMFAGRAPKGHVAIACYIGGARAPALGGLTADALIDLARTELRDLVGVRGDPVVAQTRHWARGLPQYTLGHEERTKVLGQASERHPGLFLTGNYFDGPSVAACLGVSRRVAGEVAKTLVVPASKAVNRDTCDGPETLHWPTGSAQWSNR